MILPLRIMITEESFLLVKICIPIWFMFRRGFKPDQTTRDRWFNPKMTLMVGEETKCLHSYILGVSFRVRSNKIMKKLKCGSHRVILNFRKGWNQVFESAII